MHHNANHREIFDDDSRPIVKQNTGELGMFDDDFFGNGIEDLFSKLSGTSIRRHSVPQQFNPDNLLSIVTKGSKKYFIFDLSGKNLESVSVKDNLEINEYGEKVHDGQKILEIIFDGKEKLDWLLPNGFIRKSLKHTFVNGILEVSLEK